VKYVSSGKPWRSISSITRSFQEDSPRSITASICGVSTAQMSSQASRAGRPKACGWRLPSIGM
jgi:hypothetical protein